LVAVARGFLIPINWRLLTPTAIALLAPAPVRSNAAGLD
jgi:hypothetical protein